MAREEGAQPGRRVRGLGLPVRCRTDGPVHTSDKPLARAVTHRLIVLKYASVQPGPILPIVPLISV